MTEFHCIKQPADSLKDSFYALHQLKGMVRDAEMIKHLDTIREWSTRYAGDINDADLREDFHCIQVKLSQIIIEDVDHMGGGDLNLRVKLSKRAIEARLDAQGDRRTWTTKECYKPFPEPHKKAR